MNVTIHSLISEEEQAKTHQSDECEKEEGWIRRGSIRSFLQARITAGHSRSIGLKTVESPCMSNHLRIWNAGNHCLTSAKDLSCCGEVLNVLVAEPGWWLSKTAWNKWLSLRAALFCSPYFSSLELRAYEARLCMAVATDARNTIAKSKAVRSRMRCQK